MLGTLISTARSNGSAMLVGDGGSGKSGLTSLVIKRLLSTKSVVSFIRADLHIPMSIATEGTINEWLGLEKGDLNICQETINSQQEFYLVVDQLDKAPSSDALKAICSGLQSAIAYGAIVIVACRDYEAQREPCIKALNFATVPLGPLCVAEATHLLSRLGVQHPSSLLIELARNLLHLSLIADVKQSGGCIDDIESETALWERYRLSIEDRDGQDALAIAIALSKEAIRNGQDFIPRPLPEPSGFQQLVSRGVIIKTSDGRYRFRHSYIRDYLYAWNVVVREDGDSMSAIVDANCLVEQEIARWIYRIQRERGTDAEFLKGVLG